MKVGIITTEEMISMKGEEMESIENSLALCLILILILERFPPRVIEPGAREGEDSFLPTGTGAIVGVTEALIDTTNFGREGADNGFAGMVSCELK
jgi:hypothetical protein